MAYVEQKTLPLKPPSALESLLTRGVVNLLLDKLTAIEGDQSQLSLTSVIDRLVDPQNTWLKIAQVTDADTSPGQVMTIDPLTDFESWPLECIFLANEQYLLELHRGDEVIWQASFPA